MIKIKNYVLFLLLLTNIFLYSTQTLALGVSPAIATLNFIPGETVEQEVCFRGSHTQYLNITVHGPQKDQIKISGPNLINGNILDFNKGSCFNYKLVLPETAEYPGLNMNDIYGTEMLEGVADGVGVRVQISHQIRVHVPYPGKYLEVKEFRAVNSNAKDKVPIFLTVQSKGKEVIKDTYAKISIYNATKSLLWQTETEHIKDIQLEETKSISLTWDSKDYREGRYYAEAEIFFDDGSLKSKTEFKLGGLDVNLISHTEEIVIGGLKPFVAEVDSVWSETIDNVRIVAEVYGPPPNSELLTTFETVTRILPPWGTSSIGGYVDTDKIGLGNHTMRIILYYDNTSKEYNRILSIISEPVVEPVKEPSKIFTTKNILVAVIVILLVILIAVLFSIFFPRKKEQQKQELNNTQKPDEQKK